MDSRDENVKNSMNESIQEPLMPYQHYNLDYASPTRQRRLWGCIPSSSVATRPALLTQIPALSKVYLRTILQTGLCSRK